MIPFCQSRTWKVSVYIEVTKWFQSAHSIASPLPLGPESACD